MSSQLEETCQGSGAASRRALGPPSDPSTSYPSSGTKGLTSLRAFNLDISRTWLTPPPGQGPQVREVLLHQNKGKNQTRLLVTGPWMEQGASHLHSCGLSQGDQILCQPLKHAPAPEGPHAQVSLAQGPDDTVVGRGSLSPCSGEGVPVSHPHTQQQVTTAPCRALTPGLPCTWPISRQVCAQVKRRGRPRSLFPELNGACGLLGPDLGLQSSFSFPAEPREEGRGGGASLGTSTLFPEESPPGRAGGGGDPAHPFLALEAATRSPDQERPNPHRNKRALEEDEEPGTEIAIVLDGSGSIDPPDFQKAKDFIYNMMETFYTKCFKCRFALVQFGAVIQTEFDLNDSRDAHAALQRVRNVSQVKEVTRTASAIQHVLDSIFTPNQGSQENASKVIVVLTDGDIFNDSLDLSTVIQSPSMAGIERFAIGVGDAFNKTKANQELHLIASDPDETHVFKVTDYSALDGLLGSLEQRIISVEGAVGEALQFELAQVGFSAHVLGKQQVLLGAVGAFDWAGGAMLYNTESHQFRFLNESLASHTAQYSYLGYSVAAVKSSRGTWYLAGAPRHGHKGRVLWFRPEDPARGFLPVLEGEQMGSYFGSELCALDVNADGLTDHLLVGAPFYHVLGEEGKVYVYRVHAQVRGFTPSATLSGRPQFAFARFGFAIAAVGDLDRDGLGDVAIGAPLEGFPAEGPASFGSIYIYNGLPQGIASSPSQWVRAAGLAPGLRYFGVSISGGGDLSGDGLVDVSVGSLGRAAVLRSRAVVRLRASMTFAPSMMRPGDPQNINSTLCFKVTPERPGKGAEELSLNVTVELDVSKRWKRVLFQDRSPRSQRDWLVPGCSRFLLLPMEGEVCDHDCFSNITVKVSYHLNPLGGRGASPRPVLDELSEPTAHFQLPFEKDCKNQSACVAELKLTARLSPETIVVGVTKEVTMNIHLANAGEDSFLTRMTLVHPPNLQLKRIQKPSSPAVECADPTPAPRVLVMSCKIGSAVFKTSHVNFSITWQLDGKTFPSETAEITINVTNANGQPPVIKRQKLQVKYILVVALDKVPTPSSALFVPSTRRSLVMYVDTSRGLPEYKEFQFNIHGENPFGAKFVFEVCVPTKMQGHEIITLKNITATQCRQKPGCRIRLPGGLSEAPDLQWLQLSCALSRIPSAVRLGAQLSPQLPRAPAVLCIPPVSHAAAQGSGGPPARQGKESAPDARTGTSLSPFCRGGGGDGVSLGAASSRPLAGSASSRILWMQKPKRAESFKFQEGGNGQQRLLQENSGLCETATFGPRDRVIGKNWCRCLEVGGDLSPCSYPADALLFLCQNITVLLEDHGVHILPIILGSSAGGILLLIGIIAILWKCGFFKRKYQAITAESRRNSQNPEKLIQDEN
ncbi:LOW QUALITY PROTEIN: integrin alpha-E [Sarcophilus harrisii]|uniref:LOW QUALITY PROTEIN: integrin alpha-E n=1 Tax=Sarcophilus harrisii TaxID=9305 RepID=UPI001301D3A2|nr:LOW QUALITY PROTEIN: integrin alpha-E [Sarcophilus harrisii]